MADYQDAIWDGGLVDTRNHLLDGVKIPQGEGPIFWWGNGKHLLLYKENVMWIWHISG